MKKKKLDSNKIGLARKVFESFNDATIIYCPK